MAEEGQKEKLSRSTLMGSDDGDPNRSIMMGSQDVHEYYCEPCHEDDIHIQATFYCRNCTEYMCKKCSVSHKKFKQSMYHAIQDVQKMIHKPPVSKKRPRAVTKATHVKDIKVEGRISSSALMSTNKLLVADWFNSKVVLVDTVSGRQVTEMKLSGQPEQVTRISDIEAAVTLPYSNKIVLLKTQPELSVVRDINVQGKCQGIAYTDNRLIVIFEDSHVDIIELSGKVLRTISADQKGRKIFTRPVRVTANPVTGSMYVTDWVEEEKYRLQKMSMEGRVEATYTFITDEYYSLCQVAVDCKGMVYLACTKSRILGLRNSICVDQLSAKCYKVRTLISDLSFFPDTLSYDEATQQLYVGHRDGVVSEYKLS